LSLGDGDDLQIYHDGSASYIGDFGTGTLQLISNGTGVFIAKSPFEYMGKFNTDGAVELYYDNSKKFETTAYGVDVTGTTGTDGLAVSGVSTFTGQIDGNGGANISGGESILSSATVSDLTSGRVVLAGTSGAIEDSANLTFNGTTLSAPTADLTNATIDNLTFTSGTAITSVDTDLSSVSGSDDTLASAKAIKTYVDAQITAQDLDFAGGTGTGAVDLDSQTLTIAGTTNEIETSASGQTLTIGLPDDVTILQDLTIGRDVLISRNLNVTGNVTIGGTSATIFASELKVADADIVLGIRTDESGNDISNDTTADHGGVAVASTEGTPLVSLFNPGIGESNPATYKKIMWFKTGSFSGLGTDAWLSNYAIGIGSTQVPNNVVLAAGAVNITNNDISYVRDVTIARNSTVGGTFGVTGTTTLTGALVANGNVDLGNATSDTITATGRFDSDLVPSTDNARDLGSSSLEWRNLYIDGTANIDSLVADTADINGGTIDGATIGGSSAAEGTFTNLTAQGNVDLGDATSDTITATGRFDSDLVPSTDSARDLGSTSLRWAQVWSDQVVADNIQIGVTGTNEIDTVSGNLTIDSAGGTTTIDDALSVTGNISGNLANTLTLNTSGTGLSGSQTYNNSGASTFTVTSNATSSNTGSTIVARDGSGNFNAGTITATLSGTATNATNITLADESADTTCFPVFATSATGNQAPKTGSNLTFNSANGTLSATTFSGSGTFTTVTASGDITANGNIVGDSSTNISGISSVTASTFFGDGSGLSNTGASLSAASGSQRVVLTSLTTGTMTSAATEAALAYNASTDTLTAGTFSGSGASLTSIPNGALDNSTISGVSLGSNLNTLTLNTSGTGLSGSQTYNGSGAATFTVTSNATSANTASAIVARDGSGNFSAGTITADLSGNADTATLATASTYITVDDESSDTTCFPVFTTAASGILSPKTGTNLAFNSSNGTLTATTFSGSGASLTSIPNGALTNSTISGVSLGSNLATLTRGSYLTGSNYNGSAGQTWAVDATSANTASKVVARDGSGNFSAGTITATLSGTASNANTLDSLDSSQFLRSDTADTKTSGDLTFNDNVKATFGTSGDLQIFHNGSNSYIDDAGTGNIYIRSGSTFIQGYGTGETCARFTENGSVDLYHNNSKKFETVTGGIQVTGTVTATSDIKLKENVTTIENGLDKVSQLRGVEFDFKSNGQHSLGVIAQEVEQVLPDLVTTNEEGIKSVAYGNLTAVLIEAVKELKAEVAELRARLDG